MMSFEGEIDALISLDFWAQAVAGDEQAQLLQRVNNQATLISEIAGEMVLQLPLPKRPLRPSLQHQVILAQQIVLSLSAPLNELQMQDRIYDVLLGTLDALAAGDGVSEEAVDAIAESLAQFNSVLADASNDPTSETIIQIISTGQTTLRDSALRLVTDEIDVATFIEQTAPELLWAEVPVDTSEPDNDGDGLVNRIDPDDDGDGVLDGIDLFPLDSNESADFDGDGLGDNADTDDDGDGVSDVDDAFPLNSGETLDSDNDSIGNNADLDDDNDGVDDVEDDLPLDPTETVDTDADGVGNNADLDDDGDGVSDNTDAFPLDFSESEDTDFDGVGNNADTDDDNDLIADVDDVYPEIPIGDNEDSDGDGAPNECVEACADTGMEADPDDDNDGVDDTDDYAPLDPTVQFAPIGVFGSGVKGPLVDAVVNLYSIDGGVSNFKGDIVAVGSTDEQAQITGIEIPYPVAPPYILQISAVEGTTDLTTGKYPVITQHSTIVTQESFDLGGSFYATPLTSLATAMVVQFADQSFEPLAGNEDGFADLAEIMAAIEWTEGRVKSTLGFGIGDSVSIFNTPPLIDSSTESEDEQPQAAAYRSAVEGMSAVLYQIAVAAGDSGFTTDDILNEIASDLADGEIDAVANGVAVESYNKAALTLFDQDPSTLPIPGDDSGRTVGDVKALVIDETSATGSEADTGSFEANEDEVELKPATTDPDKDDDGVDNAVDAYPEDPGADTDTDGDGQPDIAYFVVDGARTSDIDFDRSDIDDDNDGVLDESDAFPTDVNEYLDTDSDGIGNNADNDDDGDDVSDEIDAFPLDASESEDTDGDLIGNNADTDDDNDGVPDGADAFPLDASEFLDTDGDGIGNNTDEDDDGDDVNDSLDRFPLDPDESVDTDNDGVGNNADDDDDGDGVADINDAFPLDRTEQVDTDGDGVGNRQDEDDDGDGVLDIEDDYPLDSSKSNAADADEDGWPSEQDPDDNDNTVPEIGFVDTDSDGLADSGGLRPTRTMTVMAFSTLMMRSH